MPSLATTGAIALAALGALTAAAANAGERPPAAPAGDAVAPLRGSAGAGSPAPVGTLSYLVVRANFTDRPLPAAVTPAAINALYHTNAINVEDYYDRVSYGQLAIATTIDPTGGIIDLGIPATCDHILIAQTVVDALQSAGVDLSPHYGLVIFFDWAGLGCQYANRASVGPYEIEPGVNLAVAWMGSFHLNAFPNFHEIGHTLGSGHASFWACPDVTAPGPECICEYGDTLDVMGSSETCVGSSSHTGEWNAAHRDEVGTWFPPAGVATLTPGMGGVYLLSAIEDTTDGVLQALRIPRGFADALWVEFRRPAGVYDTAALLASAGAEGGAAFLHIVPSPGHTAIIDPHVGAEGFPSQDDLALRVGESFHDPCNDVTVAVTGIQTQPPRLAVNVTFGGGCVDFDDPTVAIIEPRPGAAVGGIVTIRATADDPTSGIDRVEFRLGDGLLGTVTEPVAGEPSIYELDWDTTGIPPGQSISLRADAYDDPVGCCPAAGHSDPVIVVIAAPCPEDLNGNGSVDFADILVIIGAWGPCAGPCPEDLSGNGAVDFADLLLVIAAWGPCPG